MMTAIPIYRSCKAVAHGGSHPHLVHEFVRSILEDRTPVPSDIDGAYWTGVGICAHQSAMDGGVVKRVPVFE